MDFHRLKLKNIVYFCIASIVLLVALYYFSDRPYTQNGELQHQLPAKSVPSSFTNPGRKIPLKKKAKMASFSDPEPVYYNTTSVPHPDSYFRLVHLDLKGAPPKMSYLKKMIPLFAQWGANGLLVEYEDMYPYRDDLSVLPAADAYSLEEITMLQEIAKEHNMEYIPLIQTFGHFEFVLKHDMYSDLREVEQHPQSLCPSKESSIKVVHSIIDQIISSHPGSKYLHIGADEVYYLGQCKSCTSRLETELNWDLQGLFLSHVTAVAQYIKDKYPNVVIIMWDDMLRHIDVSKMKAWKLGELVEPMVWNYRCDEAHFNRFLLPETWRSYAAVFNNIWSASAFKGATGVAQYYTDINKHIGNHQLWLNVIKNTLPSNVHFRGYALTGWQRYNHFAVLCELLPSAVPSLVMCLQTLVHGGFNAEVHKDVSKLLGFKKLISLSVDTESINRNTYLDEISNFAGSNVYAAVKSLIYLEYSTELNKLYGNPTSRVEGWLTEYHLQHNISDLEKLEPIHDMAERLLNMCEAINVRMTISLSEVYGERTVNEWTQSKMQPILAKLRELKEKSQQLLNT